LILGLSLVNYLLRFYRWQGYLRRLGHVIPQSLHFAYYLSGFALTTTPGKAGEAIRSLYLKAHGVSYDHSLAAFFVERLMDLVAIALLAVFAATYFDGYGWLIALTGMMILGILPLVHSRALVSLLETRGDHLPSRLNRALGHLAKLLRTSSLLLRSRSLYLGFGFGLLAWGAEGVAFYIILEALDLEISLSLATGIYAIAILAGALSFIPGGLGSTEAVMGLLLIAVGADPAVAVAATLICRIATLWFAVVIGFVAMGGLEWCGFSLSNSSKQTVILGKQP
jgi:uncharacterized membrane protein YbhN (UPF0104 family)